MHISHHGITRNTNLLPHLKTGRIAFADFGFARRYYATTLPQSPSTLPGTSCDFVLQSSGDVVWRGQVRSIDRYLRLW